MGRRAAELAGVLFASLVTSFVTGLALAGPNEPVLYVVGALVPLALLLAYWLWLEPRADADRLRARRLHQAVEDAFELGQPPTDASTSRDAARRAFYDRLDVSDLFEPDHITAASVLEEAHDTGRVLLARLDAESDPSAALVADISAWEHRTGDQVEFARGSGDAMSFRQPKGAGPSEPRERLQTQVLLVEIWVGDERKRAADQAKDRFR